MWACSAKSQKNSAVAQVYFDELLSHNDYYNAGEIEVVHWIGTGALSLRLKNGEAASTAERRKSDTTREVCPNPPFFA